MKNDIIKKYAHDFRGMKMTEEELLEMLTNLSEELYEKTKSGMYGEMPKVSIGKFSICQKSDKEGETGIWVEEGEEDAGGFSGDIVNKELEGLIQVWFNKYF